MSLNMYLGEVQSQTQSMNAICNATIQSMEQAIQSIDAFAIDTVLQGQTYSSAKAYLVQTFRPLAQGIICLCEELIRQNEAFPNDFQAKVASTDVIEHEIRQQIQEINQSIASIEAIEVLTPMPGVDAIVAVLIAMRKKLEEKLEHLYEFNHSSSNNYSTALQLAASITAGLTEVQSGKGFSPVSGTFSTQGLNMDWVSSIQGIIEETARKNEMKEITLQKQEMNLQEQEDNRSWHEKTALYAQSFLHGVIEFFQGAGDAALENFVGLQPHENDKLESKTTYQAGRLAGNVISIAGSIVEMFEGISLIGGSNFLTIVAEVGTGGLASPIVIPLDIAATAAGASLFAHGGFVWNKSIQNTKDTLQKIQSSGGGAANGKPSSNKNTTVDNFDPKTATNKQKGNYGEIKSSDNLLNNQSLKEAGFDLKPVGKSAPSGINDKIVKGIDGLYENANPNSNIKYVIDEAKFGSSQLGKTKDGRQMSNDWLNGAKTRKSRILKAVDGDAKLASKITKALQDQEVERVLSKVDSSGNVKTFRIDAKGDIIGEWP
ncbi:T7SS effector LXG polymorphic toxin [Bacillus cereus group sp. BcHK20]|uniref:T7SS effector LXG polymorphic toxin n=1 Tax=Bacillus cereus group sp. BcHK20 TaxID=3018091 RepID=UPI0022E06B5E|nr:T7SS effector LXG polymorphic toxin [Bacillus cereus group sp. BcHK20]MDA1902222.1 T7SS effector LXG polymorphic toxin [Bacillus cereus group sp. BcHK20]